MRVMALRRLFAADIRGASLHISKSYLPRKIGARMTPVPHEGCAPARLRPVHRIRSEARSAIQPGFGDHRRSKAEVSR